MTAPALVKPVIGTNQRAPRRIFARRVGAGPNKYLAKMASKMRKPDGLFVIEHRDLPDILHPLGLRDFTGIGRNMEVRLHAAGIHTVESLCAVPKPTLHGAWGGVMGDRLWHLLRGDEIPDLETSRKSLGHSHVLPPDSRPPDRAWPVLCKLLHKACERLRAEGLLAGSITIQLAFLRGESWTADVLTAETDSTVALMRLLDRLWRDRPEPRRPLLKVGVVLTRLCEHNNYTPQLFKADDAADNIAAKNSFSTAKHQRLDVTLGKPSRSRMAMASSRFSNQPDLEGIPHGIRRPKIFRRTFDCHPCGKPVGLPWQKPWETNHD